MERIFTDENGFYQIDLSNAVSGTDQLKEKFKTIGNFLSDADFIAETEEEILLIEYKNTEVENADNPEAFREKISNGRLYDSILKKYYGSTFYILACQNSKPVSFILIIESKFIDSVWRKRVCASIKKRLPYRLQQLPEIKPVLIKEFKVLSIQEWNEQYSMLPLNSRVN